MLLGIFIVTDVAISRFTRMSTFWSPIRGTSWGEVLETCPVDFMAGLLGREHAVRLFSSGHAQENAATREPVGRYLSRYCLLVRPLV